MANLTVDQVEVVLLALIALTVAGLVVVQKRGAGPWKPPMLFRAAGRGLWVIAALIATVYGLDYLFTSVGHTLSQVDKSTGGAVVYLGNVAAVGLFVIAIWADVVGRDLGVVLKQLKAWVTRTTWRVLVILLAIVAGLTILRILWKLIAIVWNFAWN